MQPNNTNNDHGFIGTGTPYFYPDDGSGSVFFFGNPVSASIATSSETKTRTSRKKENPGAALDSRSLPNPAELTLSTDTFQPKTWAMAMMGTAAEQTIAAKTVADEAAKARLDGYHQLANGDLDPATVVVKKGAAVIDASKYTIDTGMGLLQIKDATAAAEGDAITVSYQTKAVTKTVIDGAKVTSFKGKIVIDGMNDVTKERAKLIIPNVSLAVDGSFDWFSDDFNTITMKGTAAVGKNGEAPYTVEIIET